MYFVLCCVGNKLYLILSYLILSYLILCHPFVKVSHDMAKPSKVVLVDHLNNGLHITLFVQVFIYLSVPSGDPFYHSAKCYDCCCNLLF